MKRTLHPTIVAILLVFLLLIQPLAAIVGLIFGLIFKYGVLAGISFWVIACTIGYVYVMLRNLEHSKFREDPWENFFAWNGLTIPVLFLKIDEYLRELEKEYQARIETQKEYLTYKHKPEDNYPDF